MTKKPKKKKGFLDGYKTYDASEGCGNATQWKQAFSSRMGLDEAKETLHGDDPLHVLGLSGNPTWEEISSAYRKMARKYHPDLHPNDKDAAKNFKRIQAAYEILEHLYGK